MEKSKMAVRDKITLGLLILMSVFLMADQRIMGAVLTEIAKEYNVTDVSLGFVGSLFTILGAVVSLFFGYFTDKASRKWLLVAIVLIGEIPCILSGIEMFTKTLWGFAFWRILSGIGVGGLFPITFSLLADYFKEEHRAVASAWLGVAWGIGVVFGMMLPGLITKDFGWRISFVLIAVPNIPVVLFYSLYAKDPARGRTEDAIEDLIQKGLAYKQTIKLSDFKILFTNKTNIFTFLQGLPGTVPWGILGFWMVHYLEKTKGMAKDKATIIVTVLGAGAIIGGLIFAYVGEKLYHKNPRYMPMLCGAGVLAGVPPALVLVNLPAGTSFMLMLLVAFTAGMLIAIAGGNVKAILMNVNRPEHRGSVFAVFNLTDNIGQGFGPAVGGAMLAVMSYAATMNIAVMFWIFCGLIFFIVARYITMDRDALRDLMRQRADEMQKGA